jgi:hypothetical protein
LYRQELIFVFPLQQQVRGFIAVMLKHLALLKPAAMYAATISTASTSETLSLSSSEVAAPAAGNQQLLLQLEEVIRQ